MAKTKLLGYIIRAEYNGLLYGGENRTAFGGDSKATLFFTKRAAINAIRNTINQYNTKFPGESFVRNFGDVYAIPVRSPRE